MLGHVELPGCRRDSASFRTLTTISKLLKKTSKTILLPDNLSTLTHLAGDHLVRDYQPLSYENPIISP